MSLPLYVTRSCDCTAPRGIGFPRPTEPCEEHGNRFITEAELRKLHPAPADEGDDRARRLGRSVADPTGGGAHKAGRRRRQMRNKAPDRDWSLAQAKKEEEGCCRICKRTDRPLEFAHILGREHDEPKLGVGGRPLKELIVLPDRGIPACGPYPEGCHGEMHRKEVDVLRYLTLEEQVQAVRDAGSIEAARVRLTIGVGLKEAAA